MTRVHEAAMETILQRVLDGKYAPGDWLAKEKDLADEFGISRGAMRSAISMLEERGILEVRHGRGQQVRPEAAWHLLDARVIIAIIRARRIDLLREILDCHALLAPAAGAHAARHASAEAVAELEQLHSAVARAANERRHADPLKDPLVDAELKFQHALGRMTGNRPLSGMLAPVDTAMALARHELAAGQETALVRALRRTLKAVAAGDADAARTSVESRIAAARRWLKAAA